MYFKFKPMIAAALITVSYTAAVDAAVVVNGGGETCGDSTRMFTVDTTPDAACLAYGSNNIGDGTNDTFLNLGFRAAGFEEISDTSFDEDEDSPGAEEGALTYSISDGSGGLSGTFSIAALVGSYADILVGFKSGGNPNQQTVWAVFSIPDAPTTGNWSFTGQNGVSHAILYGRVSAVPLPAAGFLLLGALGGLGLMGRRRKKV